MCVNTGGSKYVCMYVFIPVHIYIYIYIYMYIIYISYIYIYIYINVIYISYTSYINYIYVCMCVLIHVPDLCGQVGAHICVHIHINVTALSCRQLRWCCYCPCFHSTSFLHQCVKNHESRIHSLSSSSFHQHSFHL